MRFNAPARALALACVALVSKSHAAPSVSEATASIDGLTFRLVDLAADDGIAPAFTVNGQAVFSVDALGKVLTQSAALSPLPANAVQQIGADGSSSASWQGNKLLASTIVANDVPGAGTPLPAGGAPTVIDDRFSQATLGTPDAPVQIGLTPHTELVLEGSLSLKVGVQADALPSGAFFTQNPNATVQFQNHAYVEGFLRGVASGVTGSAWDDTLEGAGLVDRQGVHQADSTTKLDHYLLRLTNESANHIDGELYLGLYAETITKASASAVPEPPAWAMVGVGLITAASVRRRALLPPIRKMLADLGRLVHLRF